jgi:hypothetical protein
LAVFRRAPAQNRHSNVRFVFLQEVHMTRFPLALAIALCVSTSPLYAQSPRLTVTAMSASIYQAPSTGSPVIGQTSKGAVLDVRAEVAGWVEVAWPKAARGIAYVPVATGWIEKPAPAQLTPTVRRPMTIDEFVHGTSPAQAKALLSGSADPSTAYIAEAVNSVSAASTPRPAVTAPNATYVAPAHFVGLGARIGDLTPSAGTPSLGGTGRVWWRTGLGVQFEILHDARTNAATAERVTALQFAPSVLYALPNAVSDYFWVRPYLGGGATIYRSTLHIADPAQASSASGSSLGLQLFGGGEMTFAGVPHFALSADLGYRKRPTEFVGFERGRIRLALSGHWFVR